MIGSAFSQILFASFAITMQLCLIAFFAARRWRPDSADRMGAAVYSLAFVAVALAGMFISTGQPWIYWAAALVYVVWAAFGYTVDRVLSIQWREPVNWAVLAPYVALYLTVQMMFWVPLWYISLSIWGVYAGLYAIGTLLNLRGHFGQRESGAHEGSSAGAA